MEKNFEKLSIEEMSLVSGGDALENVVVYSCLMAFGGCLLAPFTSGLTAAVCGEIFGPTCVGSAIVYFAR